MLACIVPLCFAVVVIVLEQIFQPTRVSAIIPYFQSLSLAHDPKGMERAVIYIKDDACLYTSNGKAWVLVE